jgi:hypothetical protein
MFFYVDIWSSSRVKFRLTFSDRKRPLHALVLGLGTELAIQMPEIETLGSS